MNCLINFKTTNKKPMVDDNDFIFKRDFYNEHNLEYLIEQGKKGEDRTTAGELQYTSNVFEDNPFI